MLWTAVSLLAIGLHTNKSVTIHWPLVKSTSICCLMLKKNSISKNTHILKVLSVSHFFFNPKYLIPMQGRLQGRSNITKHLKNGAFKVATEVQNGSGLPSRTSVVVSV